MTNLEEENKKNIRLTRWKSCDEQKFNTHSLIKMTPEPLEAELEDWMSERSIEKLFWI